MKLMEFATTFAIKVEFPLDPLVVAAFISYSNIQGLGSKTITSCVSGLNYFQKSLNAQDLMTYPLIKKALKGLRKSGIKTTPKPAIDISSLEKLMAATEMCLKDMFEIKLMKCYMAVQFFGLFRVSELLGDVRLHIPAVKYEDFLISQDKLRLELAQYKHSAGKGAHIEVCSQTIETICPIKLMNDYLQLRGTRPGPLFLLGNGKPLSKQALATRFRRCCAAAGLPPRRFSSHSLRIGAATLAAQMGKSPAEIMALGRWSSTAYLHYIRSLEPLKAPQSLPLRCPGSSSRQRPPRTSANPQAPNAPQTGRR